MDQTLCKSVDTVSGESVNQSLVSAQQPTRSYSLAKAPASVGISKMTLYRCVIESDHIDAGRQRRGETLSLHIFLQRCFNSRHAGPSYITHSKLLR